MARAAVRALSISPWPVKHSTQSQPESAHMLKGQAESHGSTSLGEVYIPSFNRSINLYLIHEELI